MTALAPALQAFFTDRLITQRNASAQTIVAYRDTFRLLLRFAHAQTGKQPFQLDLDDLHAPLIGAFLTHLVLSATLGGADRVMVKTCAGCRWGWSCATPWCAPTGFFRETAGAVARDWCAP